MAGDPPDMIPLCEFCAHDALLPGGMEEGCRLVFRGSLGWPSEWHDQRKAGGEIDCDLFVRYEGKRVMEAIDNHGVTEAFIAGIMKRGDRTRDRLASEEESKNG